MGGFAGGPLFHHLDANTFRVADHVPPWGKQPNVVDRKLWRDVAGMRMDLYTKNDMPGRYRQEKKKRRSSSYAGAARPSDIVGSRPWREFANGSPNDEEEEEEEEVEEDDDEEEEEEKKRRKKSRFEPDRTHGPRQSRGDSATSASDRGSQASGKRLSFPPPPSTFPKRSDSVPYADEKKDGDDHAEEEEDEEGGGGGPQKEGKKRPWPYEHVYEEPYGYYYELPGRKRARRTEAQLRAAYRVRAHNRHVRPPFPPLPLGRPRNRMSAYTYANCEGTDPAMLAKRAERQNAKNGSPTPPRRPWAGGKPGERPPQEVLEERKKINELFSSLAPPYTYTLPSHLAVQYRFTPQRRSGMSYYDMSGRPLRRRYWHPSYWRGGGNGQGSTKEGGSSRGGRSSTSHPSTSESSMRGGGNGGSKSAGKLTPDAMKGDVMYLIPSEDDLDDEDEAKEGGKAGQRRKKKMARRGSGTSASSSNRKKKDGEAEEDEEEEEDPSQKTYAYSTNILPPTRDPSAIKEFIIPHRPSWSRRRSWRWFDDAEDPEHAFDPDPFYPPGVAPEGYYDNASSSSGKGGGGGGGEDEGEEALESEEVQNTYMFQHYANNVQNGEGVQNVLHRGRLPPGPLTEKLWVAQKPKANKRGIEWSRRMPVHPDDVLKRAKIFHPKVPAWWGASKPVMGRNRGMWINPYHPTSKRFAPVYANHPGRANWWPLNPSDEVNELVKQTPRIATPPLLRNDDAFEEMLNHRRTFWGQ